MEVRTVRETYDLIVELKKSEYLSRGYSEDVSSRKANVFAVRNAWRIYNETIS